MRISVDAGFAEGFGGARALRELEARLNGGVAWLWNQRPRFWSRDKHGWIYGRPRPVMVSGGCPGAKFVLEQTANGYRFVGVAKQVKIDRYESLAGEVVEDGITVVGSEPADKTEPAE